MITAERRIVDVGKARYPSFRGTLSFNNSAKKSSS